MDEDVYTDDYEDEEQRSHNVVDAIESLESAVARVEAAVKEKWSSVVMVGWIVLASFLWDVPGNMWHSKIRYETEYSLPADKVIVATHPHDCAFLSAPLGEKYCHYDREVSTVRWATSTTGNPIASWDEGKTWSVFTPEAGATVPKTDTVQEVVISWKKVEE
jgi:hypothetical protein